MGGRISKRGTSSRYSSVGSSSNTYNGYPQSSYAQPYQAYVPPAPTQNYGNRGPEAKRKLERKYSKIDDDYSSLEQVILS